VFGKIVPDTSLSAGDGENKLVPASTVVGNLVPEWEEPVVAQPAVEFVDSAIVEHRPFRM